MNVAWGWPLGSYRPSKIVRIYWFFLRSSLQVPLLLLACWGETRLPGGEHLPLAYQQTELTTAPHLGVVWDMVWEPPHRSKAREPLWAAKYAHLARWLLSKALRDPTDVLSTVCTKSKTLRFWAYQALVEVIYLAETHCILPVVKELLGSKSECGRPMFGLCERLNESRPIIPCKL
jgi:hypothetical protein